MRSSSRVWEENKYRNKETRKVGLNGKIRFYEEKAIRKIYSENII